MSGFENLESQDLKASEALKNMLISEIDLIRDALVIVNMFLGEPMLVGVKYLQEFEQKNEQK